MSWRSWALAVLCLSVSVKAENDCTIHSSDGKYYDLSPLSASKDYEFTTDAGHQIVMNVCKAISHETWGLNGPDPANVGGAIQKDHGFFSIGDKNSTLTMYAGRPSLIMQNGSPCKAADGASKDDHAGTITSFICDTSVYGAGTPLLTAMWPPHDDELACVFHIEWRTHYACPTNEPGGSWGFFAVFAVLVTSLVMAYLILGTLYNRYVLQLRGFDQIPQFSIEAMKYHGREALDWFRDVMSHLYEGGQRNGWGGSVPRSWGSSNTNGFGVGSRLPPAGSAGFRRPMPRAESTTNSFSHQAQVDVGSNTPDVSGEGVGGFVRPSRGVTNPISHQSQVSDVPRQSTPPPPKKFESGSSTKDERKPFLLGDDDDDEEVASSPAPALAVGENMSSAPPSDTIPAGTPQIRGRDLGDEGVIRL